MPPMAAAISAAIDIQGAFDRMAFKECFDMQQFMSDSDFNCKRHSEEEFYLIQM